MPGVSKSSNPYPLLTARDAGFVSRYGAPGACKQVNYCALARVRHADYKKTEYLTVTLCKVLFPLFGNQRVDCPRYIPARICVRRVRLHRMGYDFEHSVYSFIGEVAFV